MSKITVEVTADDIRHGQRGTCDRCAVARAVCRTFRCEPDVIAIDGDWLIFVNTPYLCIDLPQTVRDFIDAFDNEQPVQPFTFELEAA